MKKLIFVAAMLSLINDSQALAQFTKNTIKTIGVCALACGVISPHTAVSGQKITCDFYNIYKHNDSADLRLKALMYQQGCEQYTDLSKVINNFIPFIADIDGLLKQEIIKGEKEKSLEEQQYLNSLSKLSFRLNDQIDALKKLALFAEAYKVTMQSDFSNYVDKDDWYCADLTTCTSSIKKIVDYLTEFRRYHVVKIPTQLFDNLRLNIETEKQLLDKKFPYKGIFYKKRTIAFQAKDIVNITQQSINVETTTNQVYDSINPSPITKIALGKASSLWNFIKRMFK